MTKFHRIRFLSCLGLFLAIQLLPSNALARAQFPIKFFSEKEFSLLDAAVADKKKEKHRKKENLVSQISGDRTQYLCPNNLDSAIEAIINRPQFKRSRWGILIQTLTSGNTLYSLAADSYFTPASSTKLLTTAAALLELGGDFRIRTPVYVTGEPPHLTSLRLKGQGDPSISTDRLKNIVHLLRDREVESIEKLIVDNSYFAQPGINATWEWFDVYQDYATSVSSLILNENTVSLTLLPQRLGQPVQLRWSDPIAARQWQVENQTVTAPAGTDYGIEIEGLLGRSLLQIRGELAIDAEPDIWNLAVADPAHYFLESLRHVLLTEGIEVTRGVVDQQIQTTKLEKELTTLLSPPLSVLLQEINQKSNNLYAEVLVQILGKELDIDTALDGVVQSLTKLGVEPQSYVLVDGSGLSRHNLIAPQALVQTLRLMSQTPVAEIYRSSLAVAGNNGTLKRRFQNTVIQGNFQGKTGTLSGVSTLSGYLNVPNYQPLVFSIIVNNSQQSNSTLNQAIDEIVLLLGRLKQCSRELLNSNIDFVFSMASYKRRALNYHLLEDLLTS
jgi:D-alanyl-D-alanine carboxypeptidase/D-alanyl-D-alanine-endopeptidase (penicillin-binding protein 4)